MPRRQLTRDQMAMLPHSLDELLPQDHPARFVDAFIKSLSHDEWARVGIDVNGSAMGAASYHHEVMLGVWLYGFMIGVRSSRQLEVACRERTPFIWLAGNQRPDHNTLWRFYRRHRDAMRGLLETTVKVAVKVGLVQLAVQAVDGTKVGANASKDRTYDAEGLARLMKRTQKAIDELEAQNESGDEWTPERLSAELEGKAALLAAIRKAAAELEGDRGLKTINLTDEEARLMKGRSGTVPGYNAQAMASPTEDEAGGKGMLIVAAEVTDDPSDQSQLTPMLAAAEEVSGAKAELTLADAGYHSGENLERSERDGRLVVMPESQRKRLRKPYHKDRFRYDEATDGYECPQGKRLRFAHTRRRRGVLVRVYRASGRECRACPAFGECTRDKRQGRTMEIGPHDGALRRHRALMGTEWAKERYELRAPLIEGVFGIVKERMGARRFLLRNLGNVSAEWSLLAVAFNLRVLSKAWAASGGQKESLWRLLDVFWTRIFGMANAVAFGTGSISARSPMAWRVYIQRRSAATP